MNKLTVWIIMFLLFLTVVYVMDPNNEVVGDGEQDLCGDGFCQDEEDKINCPEDCDEFGNEFVDAEEQDLCGDGFCQDWEDKTGCPKDCDKPLQEKESVQEEGEAYPFFSSWTFKIIIVVFLFFVAGTVIFFVYRKNIPSAKQPTSAVEEQKSEETKTTIPTKRVEANPELVKYIQTNLKKGFTKEQIRGELIKSGWGEKDIDAALAKF